MSIKNIAVKESYRSYQTESFSEDFFTATLREAKYYYRAVGYFRSNSLLYIAKGLEPILDRGGKIRFVVSPELTLQDKEMIKQGYELRSALENSMISSFDNNEIAICDLDNLLLLRTLVERGFLELKIAILDSYGIYHEKIGVIEDMDGDSIAFTGSLNETEAALVNNYESIDVFRSWIPAEFSRVQTKRNDFERLWENRTPGLQVIEFPVAVINKLITGIDRTGLLKKEMKISSIDSKQDGVVLNSNFNIRDYQLDAIYAWKKNGYRGILSMATGTGKTLTAISALASLWQNTAVLLCIIVCPYTHLVEQWDEDLIDSNVSAVKAYSGYDWESAVKRSLRNLRYGIKQFECILTTNNTYQSDKMKSLLATVQADICIIVDEVHNFGSSKMIKSMDSSCRFRLGLSATPKRYFDEEGTKALYDYFSGVVYELTLDDAIEMEALVPYYYFPIIVPLTDDEYEEYCIITKKIGKILAMHRDDDDDDSSLEQLYIKRSRILNLAENKIEALSKVMNGCESHFNLVYCAAGTMKNGKKQIEHVVELLSMKHNQVVTKFTAEESKEERQSIISAFTNKVIQTIVAIKCLDEGVNIPSTKNAYILASSGNEKEFIQRRGRVLRKTIGKTHANIYDFIVLPRDLKQNNAVDDEMIKVDKTIMRREIRRVTEFAKLSLNSYEANQLINDLERQYDIIY